LTSASPPSTSHLLQLPRPTSTHPGRHSVVPDLLQHLRASIFFPGPALGSPGLALVGPGQHMLVPADISGARVNGSTPLAGIYFS
jgi:hypothetical protein